MSGRRDGWRWVGLAALAFLVLFLLYPAIRLTLSSLGAVGSYVQFATRPYYTVALGNSLWLSTAATAGSLAVGVPLAALVVRYDLPLKGFIRMAAWLSLVTPPYLGAFGWVILLGRSVVGAGGVLLVLVLHHFAYVFLLVSAALRRIDPALEEAAESMGSTPWERLWRVTVPLALPAIAASGLLVFTSTLADFGTPMLIGGGLRTLPVLAYQEFLVGSGGMAMAISVILLLVALAALGPLGRAVGGRSYAMRGVRRPAVRALSPLMRAAGLLFALGLTLGAVLPQGVILVTSFLRARGSVFRFEFGLDNYRLVFDRLGGSVVTSLLYATLATAVMLPAGLLVGWVLVRRRGPVAGWVNGLLLLAQVLPGTVLGIGLLVAWGRGPLSLAGTGAILVLAYIIRRIGFAVRASAAGLKQVSPAAEEASLTLGAPPAATYLRVTLPMLLPAALSAACVSWLSTLSELSSTIMLYTGRTATISVQIYNQVLAGSFGTAAALGALLTGLTLVALWFLQRWSDGLELWGA